MGAKRLKFTSCNEPKRIKRRFLALGASIVLGLLAVPSLWAQTNAASPTPSAVSTPVPSWTSTPTWTFTVAGTDTPTGTPTPSPTSTNTFNPYATPTHTFTWDPFATDTPTVGSPTSTPTITSTYTPTVTGTIPTSTATWTNTPSISRAALAFWPTAYSNAWDRRDGWNWDLSFSYFIGTIAERDFTQPGGVDWVNPLRLWLLTSDVKYAWLDEKGDMPAFASGLLMSMLLNGDSSGAGGSDSANFSLNGSTVGGVYTVMSKSLDANSAVHFGYIYGFNDFFKNVLNAPDLAPAFNYSQLLPLTTAKLANIQVDSPPPNIFYTGFNTRMLGTNWKFEIWKPFPMDGNPILLDSQIDGLFAFNLGYERWDQGFAVLGYFNFRFTIIPVVPAY